MSIIPKELPKKLKEIEMYAGSFEKYKEEFLNVNNNKNLKNFKEKYTFLKKRHRMTDYYDLEMLLHLDNISAKIAKEAGKYNPNIHYENTEFFRYSAKKAEEERKIREQEENKKD